MAVFTNHIVFVSALRFKKSILYNNATRAMAYEEQRPLGNFLCETLANLM